VHQLVNKKLWGWRNFQWDFMVVCFDDVFLYNAFKHKGNPNNILKFNSYHAVNTLHFRYRDWTDRAVQGDHLCLFWRSYERERDINTRRGRNAELWKCKMIAVREHSRLSTATTTGRVVARVLIFRSSTAQTGSSPRSDHVEFVVDEVSLGFSPPVAFHNWSTLFFVFCWPCISVHFL
jgi:hypothetical protein